MIVVDTCVMAYLLIPGQRTEAAEALLQRDPEWCAPVLLSSELNNVMAGYLRRGLIARATAAALITQARSILGPRTYQIGHEKILELVDESELSAYDCEYVALAASLGLPLVTCDKAILRQFPTIATPLETASLEAPADPAQPTT